MLFLTACVMFDGGLGDEKRLGVQDTVLSIDLGQTGGSSYDNSRLQYPQEQLSDLFSCTLACFKCIQLIRPASN